MYDAEYAEKWIKYQESGKDKFRQEHLVPFLKNSLANTPKGSRILDVGCGWGAALEWVPESCSYLGIDPAADFFKYIRAKYPGRKIDLREGSLPDNIPTDEIFDVAICSMTLHCAEDLEKSVNAVFERSRKEDRVIITTFSDAAIPILRPLFATLEADEENHLAGVYNLSDDIQINGEAWLHKEKDLEAELSRHGLFKKQYLGPIFVGYSCIRRLKDPPTPQPPNQK